MRVFIWEYLCSGALSDRPLPASLVREGRSMLSAVVADLLRQPDCQVTTTLDNRLAGANSAGFDGAFTEIIADVESERSAFDQSVQAADVTLIIAPETDGVLADRVRRVLELGGRTANCTPAAIELCGDKWSLAQHLEKRHLPTIPTQLANLSSDDPWEWASSSSVLKPLDGAGSWLTFQVPSGDASAWQVACAAYQQAEMAEKAILQPFISGQSLSAGCICHRSGHVDVFPIGEQHIEGPTFQYRGGRIPAAIPFDLQIKIEDLIQRTCSTIPGLSGYVGFDLILPDHDLSSPVITEINPRLTTSYVGYRQLCDDNLATRLLDSIQHPGASPRLQWNSRSVRFQADGTVSFES